MGKILEAAGTSFDKVLKVTVYLNSVADRTKINPVRQEFFGAARPTSTLVGVREQHAALKDQQFRARPC